MKKVTIDEELLKDIGERIKELRIERKMSQTELSHKVNQSSTYVCQVEVGKFNLSISTLSMYLKALEVEWNCFFTPIKIKKRMNDHPRHP